MRQLTVSLLLVVLLGLVGCTGAASQPQATLADRDFVGYQVLDEADTLFGQVQSVVVDIESGTIEYVILAVERGTFANPRGNPPARPTPFIAIPWDALELDLERQALILNVTEETILGAPRLEALPNTNLADWDTEIQAYWEN